MVSLSAKRARSRDHKRDEVSMLNSLDSFSILSSFAQLMPVEHSLHPKALIGGGAAIGDTSINEGLMVRVKEALNQ